MQPSPLSNSSCPSTKWQAAECSLGPIVRSFRATVQDRILPEETLDIWTQIEDIEEYGSLTLLPIWGSEKGVHRNPFFVIGPFSTLAIYTFLSSLFKGHVSVEFVDAKLVPTGPFVDRYASYDALYALTTGEIASCDTETVDKLSCSMDNVAAAMSKTFRGAPYVAPDFYWSNATMAEGRAFSKKMYTMVHWQWIVFPFCFWVIGMVTYIGMWKGRQDKVAWDVIVE
ncbi:hypothetical protein ASPWEDRAFT_166891 [Aspergillus wentii DTO 134E9]|uniref:Uncharacterized protein n=1 Tax=Aspergillus wentii DTO 134E9 TaxID=1073089 RepID=A0A1L9S0Z3_ASPWE|nr:uncharacterized protein ASPWEDRAFT_166891 [Aspergillus wentii DTO 134E9]OJJ40834.1 hypothetical protein ASPWEDRAFT_166891 [Aspergillus wentii DTO 134E9]